MIAAPRFFVIASKHALEFVRQREQPRHARYLLRRRFSRSRREPLRRAQALALGVEPVPDLGHAALRVASAAKLAMPAGRNVSDTSPPFPS